MGEHRQVGSDWLAEAAVSIGYGQIERSNQSLTEVLRAQSNVTTLICLVGEAGPQQELNGSHTNFAPIDVAFAALPQHMAQRLRKNPDQLRSLVRQHIVSGQVLPARQIPGQLQAMNSDPLRVRLGEGSPPVPMEGSGSFAKGGDS